MGGLLVYHVLPKYNLRSGSFLRSSGELLEFIQFQDLHAMSIFLSHLWVWVKNAPHKEWCLIHSKNDEKFWVCYHTVSPNLVVIRWCLTPTFASDFRWTWQKKGIFHSLWGSARCACCAWVHHGPLISRPYAAWNKRRYHPWLFGKCYDSTIYRF
jgi:hypothetical protein